MFQRRSTERLCFFAFIDITSQVEYTYKKGVSVNLSGGIFVFPIMQLGNYLINNDHVHNTIKATYLLIKK